MPSIDAYLLAQLLDARHVPVGADDILVVRWCHGEGRIVKEG